MRKGKQTIKCVATGNGDGDLAVCTAKRWAERRHMNPVSAIREIASTAESMAPDAIPAVNLADMVNVGTAAEPRWVLELNDVSAFILAAWA